MYFEALFKRLEFSASGWRTIQQGRLSRRVVFEDRAAGKRAHRNTSVLLRASTRLVGGLGARGVPARCSQTLRALLILPAPFPFAHSAPLTGGLNFLLLVIKSLSALFAP